MKITKYTFYSDRLPGEKLAILTKKENIFERTGSIELLNSEEAPIDIVLASKSCNNIRGVDICMESRTMPSNRMFFAEYCKERGLNPNSYDDKLKIADGRSLSDDCYVEVEVTYEDD